jgi:hypothetical protein
MKLVACDNEMHMQIQHARFRQAFLKKLMQYQSENQETIAEHAFHGLHRVITVENGETDQIYSSFLDFGVF